VENAGVSDIVTAVSDIKLTKSEIYKCTCTLLKRPKRNVETFFQNRSPQLKPTNEIYNNDIGSYKHVKTQKYIEI